MIISEAYSYINSYQRQIDDYNSLIMKKRVQLTELSDLGEQLSKSYRKFEGRQVQRRTKLNEVENVLNKPKMISSYRSIMKRLLSGGEYIQAESGFSRAKNAIQDKYDEIYDEITELKRQISNLEMSIDSMYSTIRALEEEERKQEGEKQNEYQQVGSI